MAFSEIYLYDNGVKKFKITNDKNDIPKDYTLTITKKHHSIFSKHDSDDIIFFPLASSTEQVYNFFKEQTNQVYLEKLYKLSHPEPTRFQRVLGWLRPF